MYDTTDPRSSLGTTATAPKPSPAGGTAGIAAPGFHDVGALGAADGGSTVAVRAQNVVTIFSRLAAGDELDLGTLCSEAAIVVTDEALSFDLLTDRGTTQVCAPGLVVVPPGAARVVARSAGWLFCLVEAGEEAWATAAVNTTDYAVDHPQVALLEPWPEPAGGHQVRVYPLADVPVDPQRFGRIFRTRSFMVNFLTPYDGPRDPAKLSPHTHDDFEQLSVVVAGEYVHHVRTPWLKDSTVWREDDHVRIGAPSVTIIPPPTVHTSQAVGEGHNAMIDVFSPPRTDFSAKPGWVLNADDYPMA
ncbi:hypothetical protein [Modestobacter sp. VKM Ac-2978]|uniref:hypothetical protein n=1 Tax=Modestobacter sp. VKM Ac-2978 TaxID=3004132 RepID=UPI0022AB1CA2|nr:hypothetical protein [Modestobacter sp. VKM Ac-2978]MCZ2847808.1 hypothetical protein [Modestobacter sp. VKM Ac-2978]